MRDELIFDVRGAAYRESWNLWEIFLPDNFVWEYPLFVTGTKNILFHFIVL